MTTMSTTDPSFAVVCVDGNDTDSRPSHRTVTIPQLAFGLYKVPNDEDGERIVVQAIKSGYRHFDSASVYGNEVAVGRGFQRCLTSQPPSPSLSSSSCRSTTSTSTSPSSSSDPSTPIVVSRSDLYVASKVWNDAQRQGRGAVRRSVLTSLRDLQLDYLDICYVHWPVPDHYIDTYKELQALVKENKIHAIGISNFTIDEYKTLIDDVGVTIQPQIHQFEVSPFMYRPSLIHAFQQRGILVAASKALNRTAGMINNSNIDKNRDGTTPDRTGSTVERIAAQHGVSTAQVMLRWSYQKGLIVLAKTSNVQRMKENRNIMMFELSGDEMKSLDGLTSEKDIQARADLEEKRKQGG